MRSNKFRYLLVLSVLLAGFGCSVATAQNGINSPYSRFGLGLITDQSMGMYKAMGGVGTGMRLPNSINMSNPASFSNVDTLTFLADFGLSLQNGNFQEKEVRVNAANAKFEYAAMQFRVQPKIGMTIAMMPFSNIGYNYSESGVIKDPLDGNVTYSNAFYGYGGVREFSVGLGWRATKWASLGGGVGFISGDITNTVTNSYSQSTIPSRARTSETFLSAFDWNLGVQTTSRLFGGTLVLGATWAPALDFNAETTVTDVRSGTDVATIGDTVTFTGGYGLPERIKAGFSYSLKKFVFAADASYQPWAGVSMNGNGVGRDRLKYSAGLTYCPEDYSPKFLKRCTYNFGGYYQQPYYSMNDGRKGPSEFGASAGITLPFSLAYNSMTLVHLSGSYVRVQPSAPGMITENYMMLSLGVSFRERWFMKWLVE